MLTCRRSRLLLVAGVLAIALASYGLRTPRRVSPAGQFAVGTWLTPLQPEGFSTEVVLRDDATGCIRWLDGAGEEDTARAPEEGIWEVAGDRIKLDTRQGRGGLLRSLVYRLGVSRHGLVVFLSIENGGLAYAPQSDIHVPLSRVDGAPP